MSTPASTSIGNNNSSGSGGGDGSASVRSSSSSSSSGRRRSVENSMGSSTGSVIRTTRPHQARATNGEFTELARQIRDSGFLRRRYGYYWTRLALVPIAYAVCTVAIVLIGNTWWQMFSAAVLAFVFTQTAFLGHDAAHRQIFRSGKWNDWVSLIISNLFVGMSYGWWQHKHTRHHANPNREGSDPDIELPVIAVTTANVRKHTNPVIRWILAHQGWFFFPILLLEGLSMHASSVRRLFRREPLARRPIEMLFVLLRLGGYLTLVFLVLTPGKAAVFLAIQLGLFGLFMGMSFAPNHKGMPIVSPEGESRFPPSTGVDESEHPGEQAHRPCDGWAQLPDRTSPVSVDASPAPSSGVADDRRLLSRPRCDLHRDEALGVVRDRVAVHQPGGSR